MTERTVNDPALMEDMPAVYANTVNVRMGHQFVRLAFAEAFTPERAYPRGTILMDRANAEQLCDHLTLALGRNK